MYLILFSSGRNSGNEPSGMDWKRDCPKETQALFKIPNARVGERVPFQCLCLQAKTVGIGQESESDGTTGKNMVPKQKNEEQEKQSEERRKQPKQQ